MNAAVSGIAGNRSAPPAPAGRINAVLGKDPARRSTLASGSSPATPGGGRHHLRPVNSPPLACLKKFDLDRLRPSDFITTGSGREDQRGHRNGTAGALTVANCSSPARPGGDHHHRNRREDQRGPRHGSGAAVDSGQLLITGNAGRSTSPPAAGE